MSAVKTEYKQWVAPIDHFIYFMFGSSDFFMLTFLFY